VRSVAGRRQTVSAALSAPLGAVGVISVDRSALDDRMRTTLVWSGVFVVLLTLTGFQLHSEWGQIAVAFLANVAFGYAVGRLLLPGRPALLYVGLGLLIDIVQWLLIVAVSVTFYAGAAAYPVGTWFIRFALGGALAFTGGAMAGDLSARKKLTVNTAVVASVVSIAGGVLTLIKG